MTKAASATDGGTGGRTSFAPALRSSAAELRQQAEQIANSPLVEALLSTAHGLLAVLNENRQIVTLNCALLETLGVPDPAEVLGMRPGEAVGCVHAKDNPGGGCGTGPVCSSCGAAIAIVACLATEQMVERTCCIEAERHGLPSDLYLSVRAQKLTWADARWVCLFLQDVSAQQELAVLQRVFFHDVANHLTALLGSSYRLKKAAPPELRGRAQTVEELANQLAQEVALQRLLFETKSGSFVPKPRPIAVDAAIQVLRDTCQGHTAARDKRIRSRDATRGHVVETDPVVLNRVLSNMLINALEATEPGGEVEVCCERNDGSVVFMVANAGEMPPEVAGRIFQRNFSTKQGPGRGLGTYSMKLFGEKILGGEVGFCLAQGRTTFSLRLPNRTDS